MHEELERLYQQASDSEDAESDFNRKHRQSLYRRVPVTVALLLLYNIISTIILAWIGIWPKNETSVSPPEDYAIPPRIPANYKRFWWRTEYSSNNKTRQDELWDNIVWTYGMIGVDHDWAMSQHWPKTMQLPQDETKSAYLLQAYHEVHCLVVLRRIMGQSLAGVDFSNSEHTHTHIAHCFDYMLQSVMCHADSTPLYTFGNTIVGSGQQHECKDWNKLRDHATKHSACYTEEHGWGQCSDGDGLVSATPLEDY